METIVRNRKAPPKAMQTAIFRRDGFLCVWCKRPVVFAPVMKYLELEVKGASSSAELAYYHGNWSRRGAPLLDELGAVIDHVDAFSTGGADTFENLVTACNKCNGRKNATQVAEWKALPRKFVKGKYGEPIHWDGLSALFIVLAERHPTSVTAVERDWIRALKATPN